MSDKVVVKFVKNWGIYNASEVAGFELSSAAKLIAVNNVAIFYDKEKDFDKLVPYVDNPASLDFNPNLNIEFDKPKEIIKGVDVDPGDANNDPNDERPLEEKHSDLVGVLNQTIDDVKATISVLDDFDNPVYGIDDLSMLLQLEQRGKRRQTLIPFIADLMQSIESKVS